MGGRPLEPTWHRGARRAPSQLSLPTNRAFVMQSRATLPETAPVYHARVKHLVSGQVVRCHPGGIPMPSP
jgi:hypothetical protein